MGNLIETTTVRLFIGQPIVYTQSPSTYAEWTGVIDRIDHGDSILPYHVSVESPDGTQSDTFWVNPKEIEPIDIFNCEICCQDRDLAERHVDPTSGIWYCDNCIGPGV